MHVRMEVHALSSALHGAHVPRSVHNNPGIVYLLKHRSVSYPINSYGFDPTRNGQ